MEDNGEISEFYSDYILVLPIYQKSNHKTILETVMYNKIFALKRIFYTSLFYWQTFTKLMLKIRIRLKNLD